ncbi:MAG TPA: hypothetical protein VE999_10785 [Gemmataceae bacterium]|jgi:hypothetical protein|nr:hypothetical protein [Gemmataceae bacterium]
MEAVVKSALKHIPDENARRGLYRDVMPALENQDWNDHPDLFGLDPIYDQVVRERHGDRRSDDDT